jgi:hypothetical protein
MKQRFEFFVTGMPTPKGSLIPREVRPNIHA